MKKTLAIPARLAKEYLTDAERAELAKFGEQSLEDAEIRQRQLDEQDHAATLERRAKQSNIDRIKSELDAIDRKSIRALREGDTKILAEHAAQAIALRKELAKIE